jgi:hypothetical protein
MLYLKGDEEVKQTNKDIKMTTVDTWCRTMTGNKPYFDGKTWFFPMDEVTTGVYRYRHESDVWNVIISKTSRWGVCNPVPEARAKRREIFDAVVKSGDATTPNILSLIPEWFR